MGKRQTVEYSLQVVMLKLWVVVVQSKLLCTIYKLLCLKFMSLWANDKPLSIAYGRYAQIIGCYGSKQVVVYNLQVVVLEKQSLWAKDKPLSIAYRSLCSNYKLLWTSLYSCVGKSL